MGLLLRQIAAFGSLTKEVIMIPDLNTARRLLEEGWQRNPGPWKNHSLTAAHCAKTIAERLKMRGNDIDPEKACILSMLHDIGRREGVTWLAHTIDGYDYLMSLGYDEPARICLTHSFPEKDVNTYIGRHDISAEDEQRLVTLLQSFDYDDYDRLIQLCDSIAMPDGPASIIERMTDVKNRYGHYPQSKWDKNLELKRYFEDKMGCRVEEAVGISPL